METKNFSALGFLDFSCPAGKSKKDQDLNVILHTSVIHNLLHKNKWNFQYLHFSFV